MSLRLLRFLLAVFLALAAMGIPRFVKGADAVPAAKAAITPEQEKKFAEILTKAKAARTRVLETRMKKEIEDLTKSASLEPKDVAVLESAAKEAVDQSAREWTADIEAVIHEVLVQLPGQRDAMLAEGAKEVEEGANEEVPGKNRAPTEQTVWRNALKSTLKAEQFAAWEAALTERKNLLEKQFANVLKNVEETFRQRHRQSLDRQCARLKRLLKLTKEREEALDALAKSALDQCVNEWLAQARKIVFSADENQREMILKVGNLDTANMAEASPEQEAVWKDGLPKLFSAQELARMESELAERKERRSKALGQLLITELDRVVAFSSQQRERLQPIAERMSIDPVPAAGDFPVEYDAPFEPMAWLAPGKEIAEAEAKPILDAEQWTRWQTAANSIGQPAKGIEYSGRGGFSSESEDLEQELSDFLFNLSTRKRKAATAEMVLKAEDASRAAGLDKEASRQLCTAARGAVERSLEGWRQAVSESIRGQVRNLSAENARKRLSAWPDVSSDSAGVNENEAIWSIAVKETLTAAQQAAWKKARDEREAFRQKSIAWLILTELDRKNPITTEQWERLEPLLEKSQRDYAEGLESFRGTPWYLTGYMLFIPLAAVAESDLKPVLSEEQYRIWTASSDYTNALTQAQSMRQTRAFKSNGKKP